MSTRLIRHRWPATFALLTAVLAAPFAGGVELEPCRLSDASGRHLVRAACGEIAVPVDPADATAGELSLYVAKVEALSRQARPVALTVIAGGPGQASTDFYAGYHPAFERLRESFDIILVDQRGTGRSHRQTCPTPDTTLGDVWSLERSRQLAGDCLDALDMDPRYFTTSLAVRDLDQVREAFGYERLSLYGVSYGTRVAQHYLRRFPERTHSVILDGVVPVDLALGPEISLAAQRALDIALARCLESPDCREVYPDIRGDFARMTGRLETEPVAVSLPDPLTAEPTDVTLSYLDLAGAIRLLSYSAETVALLPLFIHSAAGGNYRPITAEALSISRDFVDALAFGMHNSVVCSEDAPFYDGFEADDLADTYLGRYLYDGLSSTCEIWPRGIVDDDFKMPFASDVPVLVLSGEADPVTPPAYGERAVEYLGNARHIVVTGQGHGMAAVGCMPRLMSNFVMELDPDGLDASCLDGHDGEPFFTSFTGPGP